MWKSHFVSWQHVPPEALAGNQGKEEQSERRGGEEEEEEEEEEAQGRCTCLGAYTHWFRLSLTANGNTGSRTEFKEASEWGAGKTSRSENNKQENPG
ncbi:hypothetical protein AAFF_G00055870 [Aldrovandia affinis]|uniref:Uncharacterized protein n=1 Tax=Aldrovandia affinis TaxID=143900 RepID=A0AAD7S0V8_9TELE|nr:hypothetical protein AAFF_G00055870 [Aldrovandia affinis]